MPRISADSIPEHVAQQRAAIVAAAVELFTTRGYAEVTLADVAAEVGLARNSLYRYVPDKLHLLVEWYRAAVPRITAEWAEAVAGDDPPDDRLLRWVHHYLAWAASPEHRLVAPLTDQLGSLDPDTQSEVGVLHRSMMQVVAGVISDAGVPDEEIHSTLDLVSGLTIGAAGTEARLGRPDEALRRRLDAAVRALVAPEPA